MRVVPLLLAAGLLAGCASPDDPGADPAPEVSEAAPSPADASPSQTAPSTPESSPDQPAATPTKEPSTKAGKKAGKKSASKKPSRQAKPGTAVVTGGSQYGQVLFDGARQAIYIFDKETTSRPQCYGACAEAWPPVLARGEPVARGPVRDRLLGTTKRRDGSRQVTYAGQPLYYYAHEGPGQVLCHDVPGFGGLWLALRADGTPPA